MGLVALHDRVQTTATTLDAKAFTANKVQRHGCYQPTPMGDTPYGHSTFITELLTWVHGRMGLVALHDRVQTTSTTLDGKTFTANKVQRHGCYQPTPMEDTHYGHSTFITELLTWVHGRIGLVALHDRVQTTATTLDAKAFTANKVQRHGCYQPTPMADIPYGHSTFITELLTWVHGRMGLVALHDRVQTTATTLDGNTFTANKVQRHGCYQPRPMEDTPYGHSTFITELLTWVHGRMGLVALHDRVQTTATTLDGNTFTANKVQRHGCYQPTPMRDTPYGHSTFISELLTWVHGRMGLVALHDRVQTTATTLDGNTFTANKVQRHGCYQPRPMEDTPYGHSTFITELLTWVHGRMGLVLLHDRVQTTATTLDAKAFTANKVQRHGCYQPRPMEDTPYGHSTFITELLTWVH
jgi:recombinational DNA repair protein (RecF pathway)